MRRWPSSRKCWSRTGARSRSGSSGPCASSGSARSRSTPTPIARARHAAYADEAYALGGETAAESYLVAEKLVAAAAARRSRGGASGLRLPRRERGLRARVRGGGARLGRPAGGGDRADGDEDGRARDDAGGGGADRPGHDRPGELGRGRRRASARSSATRCIVKAVAGGGGKGMKLVHSAGGGRARLRVGAAARGRPSSPTPTSTSSATSSTRATSRCRCSPTAHGNVIHLGERDCTIQRRHQKLIEETPSPAVDEELRARIGADRGRRRARRRLPLGRDDRGAALRGRRLLLHGDEHPHPGRAHGHRGGDRDRPRARAAADRRGRAALADAGGRSLQRATRSSAGSTPRTSPPGSCRLRGRSPSTASRPGPGVRVDSGVAAGSEISPLYDPMIAKLIVHDVDRESARRRMLRALDEFELGGVKTLLGFHRALLRHPCFVAGGTCHGVVESDELAAAAAELERAVGRRGCGAERPRARAGHPGRGGRAPLRRQGARARAALGRAGAAPGASGGAPPAAAPTRRS